MSKKTKEEIKKQIKALKSVRPNIVPRSAFGDNNIARLDAQVKVLEENMDEDEIWDKWSDMDIAQCAIDALQWMEGDSEIDDLAEDWPLKK